MIEKIDLNNYSNCFIDTQMENIGKVNFVFGKNGTGKSTLTQAIKNQYHGNGYNVRIYDGYSKIFGENNRLDALALGEENVTVMEEIEEINKKIKNLNIELKVFDEEGNIHDGLEKEKENIKNQYQKYNGDINSFFTNSARTIKRNSNPMLVKPGENYDKNSFKNEIQYAKLLDDDEVNLYKQNNSATFIDIDEEITFPSIDTQQLYLNTKKLLDKSVSPSVVIETLDENIEKKNFAQVGFEIHTHEDDNGYRIHDEHCAFCDNVIKDERWELLDQYFTNEITLFLNEITQYINDLEKFINQLEVDLKIDGNYFHQSFKERVDLLNQKIEATANSNIIFINKLIEFLKDKKNYLTTSQTIDKLESPDNFNVIQKDYSSLYKENVEFNNEIDKKKMEAQNHLRFHKIHSLLTEFDYDLKNELMLEQFESLSNKTIEIKEVNDQIDSLNQVKKELISKTKSEEKLAKEISELLKTLSEISFTLELVEEEGEAKGQYKILGDNGEFRNITEISEGEKNIIGFLYFMKSINDPDDPNNDPKIIILDDPMTSNDNTYQYLILGLIKQFYGNFNTKGLMNSDDMLFIFTHSTYFYINVCPFSKNYKMKQEKAHKEARYFKLIKDGNRSTILNIKSKKEDISTSYNLLWDELKYAHENGRPKVMWNIMRRILETFSDFNDISINEMLVEQFDDPIDKILGEAMHISLNDNSHSIVDSKFDADSYSADTLMAFFEKIFSKKLNFNHFDKYIKT